MGGRQNQLSLLHRVSRESLSNCLSKCKCTLCGYPKRVQSYANSRKLSMTGANADLNVDAFRIDDITILVRRKSDTFIYAKVSMHRQ